MYGGVEAEGIRFENVDTTLRVPESQLRLFGKPVAHERRRMGVALATADSVETARKRAKECAAKVRPVR